MTQEELLLKIEEQFGPGCAAICKERRRQIEIEGFHPFDDVKFYKEEEQLAKAAACYALPSWDREIFAGNEALLGKPQTKTILSIVWPWTISWWKPSQNNRSRELAKSGALSAAQIDVISNQNEQ